MPDDEAGEKQGDLSDCKNWRGITLLSLTSYIFIDFKGWPEKARMGKCSVTNHTGMNDYHPGEENP